MIHLERLEKEIIKIYQKSQGIKKTAYSEISLFKMMLLNYSYDLGEIGREELVKEYLCCMNFFF
ncbi:MAG: hypothetical protein ACMUEL_05475 [Flavobacteriales bacterium Tduv]